MVLTYTCAIFKTTKGHKTLHQFCGSLYVKLLACIYLFNCLFIMLNKNIPLPIYPLYPFPIHSFPIYPFPINPLPLPPLPIPPLPPTPLPPHPHPPLPLPPTP